MRINLGFGAMTTSRYSVEAFNTSTASANKIHDDAVAKSLGFRGGLVPGVDDFAYLAHLPAQQWGRRWLEGGTLSARFAAPVYDGDVVSVEATEDGEHLQLALVDPSGATCATGVAGLDAGPSPALDDFPIAPLPEVVPPASPAAFAALPGGLLGSLEYGFHSGRHGEYLDAVRETLPLYRDEAVAHPGWLLRMANYILSSNVRLGPWIHVSSDMRLHGTVEDGATVSVRGRVVDVTERKGHRFVDLDVVWVVDATHVVASARHTAIYEPRGVREAAGASDDVTDVADASVES